MQDLQSEIFESSSDQRFCFECAPLVIQHTVAAEAFLVINGLEMRIEWPFVLKICIDGDNCGVIDMTALSNRKIATDDKWLRPSSRTWATARSAKTAVLSPQGSVRMKRINCFRYVATI